MHGYRLAILLASLSYAAFGIVSINRVIGAIEAYLKLEIKGDDSDEDVKRGMECSGVHEIKDKLSGIDLKFLLEQTFL